MKHLALLIGTIATLAIMLAWAGTPFAGVVLTETSTASGPNGNSRQKRVIYIQGNKQKVEGPRIDEITDLDSGLVYVVDKHDRAYAAVPLRAMKLSQQNYQEGETIRLVKTAKKRTIANQPCIEYSAVKTEESEQVAVSACVAKDAPGASEVAAFEHKMASRLNHEKSRGETEKNSPAMVLEKRSVVSFRVPDLSGRKPYRVASIQTDTEVSDIKVKPLPAQTFEPPKGFKKFEKGNAGYGPNLPGGVEVMAPNPRGEFGEPQI